MYIFADYETYYDANYPYIFIIKYGKSFKLYKVNKELKRGIYNSESWIMKTVPETMIVFILETSTGGDTFTNNNTVDSSRSSITGGNSYTIVWSNYDILDTSGALYFAKSARLDKYNTLIFFTPSNGTETQIWEYDSCSTSKTSSDRAGSFSVNVSAPDDTFIDTYPIGTDVFIKQAGSWFRGYIKDPPKTHFGTVRTVAFSGVSYAGLTQRLYVNEKYENTRIDTIVKALFHKYLPGIEHDTNITTCTTLTSVNWQDVKLWDAMEQLSERAGFNWTINQKYLNDSILHLFFYDPSANTATETIGETGHIYQKGTAKFSTDSSKLVNRLIVKVNNADVNGVKYNVRLALDDATSQSTYGVYEEIYTPKATYINDIILLGQAYLDKYKEPIKSGSIKPIWGEWKVDQKVNINIPDVKEDSVYTISAVTLTSDGSLIDRSLTLTQSPRDYTDVVKKINDRLLSLETAASDVATTFNPLFYYYYTSDSSSFNYNYINSTTYPGADVYPNDEVILSLRTSSGEILRKAYSDLVYNAANDATYSFYLDAGEATGTIIKMSLYSKGATATLGTGTELVYQTTNIIKTALTVFKIDWRVKRP